MTQNEALKLALEALEREARGYAVHDELQIPRSMRDAITAIKEALAQPEHEKERCVGCEACIDTACGRDECPKGWPKAPQRTWVGLTDDEMWNAYAGGSDIINLDYAKAIEARLREKNNA